MDIIHKTTELLVMAPLQVIQHLYFEFLIHETLDLLVPARLQVDFHSARLVSMHKIPYSWNNL